MDEKRVQVTIKGTSPLLMHSDRGANPLSDEAKALKAVSSKRKKTEDDYAAMMEIEWNASLYLDGDGAIVMPVENMRATVRDGAKLSKMGKEISRKVFLDGEFIPLTYGGPRDRAALFADARFRDTRSVRVGQQRVMRTRPVFRDWSLTFTAYWQSDAFDVDLFKQCLESAGGFIGLGDFRPDKGGTYGRFILESIKEAARV